MKKIKQLFISLLCAIFAMLSMPTGAFADVNFSVSPPYEKITLTPGETFYGSVTIVNPSSSTTDFNYLISTEPFYVDESNETVYDRKEDRTFMADWIKLDHETGILKPNSSEEIKFTINVPKDAPAGGQYASIMVSTNPDAQSSSSEGLNIKANYRFSHLIYADVAGESIHDGAIHSVEIPSFLFSGKITATSMVENKGNTHAEVSHTLQIYPLFSNEEVYTNEEEPATSLIMPGVKRTTSISWNETPSIGIFRVLYNIEFEGVKSTVDKYVIVCPLWLLFLILLALFLLIFKIVWGKKKDKK